MTTADSELDYNLAAYYTPIEVAQLLTDWAVTDAQANVLDPSFGGCAFLYAAQSTLRHLGSQTPACQVYGVDIDINARIYTQQLLQSGAIPEQFVITDFFQVTPESFAPESFEAVVGNPPYIRYHDIPRDFQERAVLRLQKLGIQVSKRASYWAFFLLYSMQFLRRGGRLAMILPGAFLHTDYAAEVRQHLLNFFCDVTFLLLQERIFNNTEEESVLVCASGARKPHKAFRVGNVANVTELRAALTDIEHSTRVLVGTEQGTLLRGLLDRNTLDLYDELQADDSTVELGDWVTASIGVVTGNNNYFILSSAERERLNLEAEWFVPIVRRSSSLRGLWVEDRDFDRFRNNGHKHLLLQIGSLEPPLPEALGEYIQYGENNYVDEAQKCRARKPWYAVPRTFVPPAFLQCMSASWPRLVVNRSRYTCTNNILRLRWAQERPADDWVILALGTLSTLGQLSAELVGRSYGGGVLKLEPSELTKLVVPLVSADQLATVAAKAHSLLQKGRQREATQVVDAALSVSNPRYTQENLTSLRLARDTLFLRRRRHRKDAISYVESDTLNGQSIEHSGT